MSSWFKRNGIHFLIAAIFLLICYIYFMPVFQGKTLGEGDVIGAQSTQKEINDYKAKGVTILWTNQIYGGMPAFQIWAPYPDNITTGIVNVLTTAFPNPLYIVFLLLFGSYFLCCVLKLNPWLAAAGAIAFTFSSYNIILVQAGHTNQVFAIALFAPILAGIFLILRGKYWLGSSLLAFFLALEIRANHIQMTYYLLIIILILAGIELYRAIKEKTTAAFVRSVVFIAGAAIVAIAVNASLLWSTYEYGQETIRGQSNLTQQGKKPADGLTKDYVYEYSQTAAENLTFLVPNAYGGVSPGFSAVDLPNSALVKTMQSSGITQEQAQNVTGGLSSYWGDKPITSGPHYLGAVVCFMFILGLLIVKNPIKWWLAGSVALTIFLSIGYSFPYVSDLFFNYFPLYNKFRAIESILSVTGLCVPLLALLALGEVTGAADRKAVFKKIKTAFYITAGLTVILVVYPELFLSFRESDQSGMIDFLSHRILNGNTQIANSIAEALVKDRENIERADALRSLIFIVIAFGLLWAFIKQKINAGILSILFFGLILLDLWQVDKRYLNEAEFQDKQQASEAVQPRGVDQAIDKDTDPDFRVFDKTHDIKHDVFNPFFHKSITGYSAARLKRYDELMDNQLVKTPPSRDVLNMLNTKYFITADTGQSVKLTENPAACGHAWFVKSVKFVGNADQEMQAISAFAPKDEAVVDQRYKNLANTPPQTSGDTSATIKLTSYTPDHLTYQTSTQTSRVAVFSEIWYDKGWTMLVDGRESPYFRADYVLRAAQIPAGQHTIEFVFHPASYYTGEKISLAGSILLILALGGAAYAEARNRRPAGLQVMAEAKTAVVKRRKK